MKAINNQKHITYHELKAQIYPYSVHFFTLDFSDEKAQKDLKENLKKLDCKFKVKKHLQQGRGWCISVLAASVVLIDTKRMQKDAMSVLSAIRHETHHAAKECLDYVGSEFGADDEHFMYLCDWFFCKGVEVVFGDKFGVPVLPAFEPETEATTNTESELTADIEPKKETQHSPTRILSYVCQPRHWEGAYFNGVQDDALGSLAPCHDNGYFAPIINIDTGQILNWKQGVSAVIHYKTVDMNKWTLSIDGNYENKYCNSDWRYVPAIMSPKENGYGDYIIMDISESGYIKDWKPSLIDSLSK